MRQIASVASLAEAVAGVAVGSTSRGGEVEEVVSAAAGNGVVAVPRPDDIVRAVALDDVRQNVAAPVERAGGKGQVLESAAEGPGGARDHGVVTAGIGQDVARGDEVRIVAGLAVHRVGAGAAV